MTNDEKIKAIQTILGVVADGIFGKKSKAALARAGDELEIKIQAILGVEQDGMFGRRSKAALMALLKPVTEEEIHEAANPSGPTVLASSFADAGDVRAFRKCKSNGHSDKYCFGVGDNAIGYGGLNTSDTDSPMAALPRRVIEAKWGSLIKGHKKPIDVTYKGNTVRGIVGDYMSAGLRAKIDLNPGFQTKFGVEPPFLIPVQWRWVE
jgi:hypothetical protein